MQPNAHIEILLKFLLIFVIDINHYYFLRKISFLFCATFSGLNWGGALHGTPGPVCTLPFGLLSCSTYVPKTNN